jgi:hypothetical protein
MRCATTDGTVSGMTTLSTTEDTTLPTGIVRPGAHHRTLLQVSDRLLLALPVDGHTLVAQTPQGVALAQVRERLTELSRPEPAILTLPWPVGSYHGIELRDPFDDRSRDGNDTSPVRERWIAGGGWLTRYTDSVDEVSRWEDPRQSFERWLSGPAMLGALLHNDQVRRLRRLGMPVPLGHVIARSVSRPADRLEDALVDRIRARRARVHA